MTLPIIFMYSGQGSQYYRMGEKLYHENFIFHATMQRLDVLCQNKIGRSVIEYIYDASKAKADAFDQTNLSHIAIYMIEYAFTELLAAHQIKPDFSLGTSMGEFAAAVTSGIIVDVESGLEAVIKQGEAMEACPEGEMLAVFDNPELYDENPYIHENSELASVNFYSHFVVAGTKENIKNIHQFLKNKNIICQILPVNRGFHSSLIDNGKGLFLDHITGLNLQKPKIPFISCLKAQQLSAIAHEHLWNIIRYPILFWKTIQYMESQKPAIYVDLGPSGTLATFAKYILSKDSHSKTVILMSPMGDDVKNLQTALAALYQNDIF